MSRLEKMLGALLNGEQVDITPRSRLEQYLKNCCDKCGCDGLPAPRSRAEALLYQLAEQLAGGSGGGTSGGTDERFKQLIERTITEVSDDTLTSVSYYAFYNCTQLTSINLPLVTGVGGSAFNGCTQLTSVNLPSATSVSSNAFNGCSKLTSINLPLVTGVGGNAFYNCAQLTSINLPLVTSVGSSAFDRCSKLTSINLPLVTSVGGSAFYKCSQLSCVIFRTEKACTLSNANAFDNTPFASGKAGGTLLVPRALVESYKTATNWSVIWGYGHNRFLALEDYTVDGTITGEIDWDKLNGGAA